VKVIRLDKTGKQFEDKFIYGDRIIFKEAHPKIKDVLKGTAVKWWIGTDALTLVKYPPGSFIWHIRILLRRIYYKLIHKYIDHWIVAEHLGGYLYKFGIHDCCLVIDPPIYKKIRKRKHRDINILYYYPKCTKNRKFKEWVYGYDIFKKVESFFEGFVNFIVVDGSQNMNMIYSIIDGYIRPNRHDGWSRMLDECEINKIPYYFDGNFNPTVDGVIEFVQKIIKKRCASD